MLSKGKKCIVKYHTLQRWIRKYNEKKILLLKSDEGIETGRPTLVPISNLPCLNNRVLQNSGKVDTLQDLQMILGIFVNKRWKKNKDPMPMEYPHLFAVMLLRSASAN